MYDLQNHIRHNSLNKWKTCGVGPMDRQGQRARRKTVKWGTPLDISQARIGRTTKKHYSMGKRKLYSPCVQSGKANMGRGLAGISKSETLNRS